MISADTPVFPNNVVALLDDRLTMIDPEVPVFKRPIRTSDPTQCIGIVPVQWSPNEDSKEMKGRIDASEPTLGEYVIAVQAFIKDMEEERGLATHSVLSQTIRSMLYRDRALAVGFASLGVTIGDTSERMQRWGVRRQAFVSNEISGAFLYMSTLEFWFETEII